MIIAGSYLYWGAKGAIARVGLDGHHLDRHYIGLPAPKVGDGEVEDGLATDGRYLYFAQCATGAIGRVPLLLRRSYTTRTVTWVTLGADCPQGLDYGKGFLYYSTLHDIGRVAEANAAEPDDHWGKGAVARSGPDNPNIVGDYVYWQWCGGPQCTPNGVGRTNLTTGKTTRRYLSDVDVMGTGP
jgi:hypothetical protein